MAYRLSERFQGPPGFYNALGLPFTERFHQNSFDKEVFVYFASMYPVIEIQYAEEFRVCKRSEKLVSQIQQQDRQAFPAITQCRYSRKFSFPDESQDSVEYIQSARGLFEYAYGELDTMSLDLQQVLMQQELNDRNAGSRLLQINPLWILAFPASSIVSLFRFYLLFNLTVFC